MLLQAALNGRRTRAEHAAVPITAAELQADALACEAAGAHGFHVHPRDADGVERLDPEWVDAAANAVHDVSRWPVSVSTGPWMQGEQRHRAALLARWTGPDGAIVHLSEDEALDTMRTLLGRGIRVEAGLRSVEDADLLLRSGLADRIERILVELLDRPRTDLVAVADEIHARLDHGGVVAPRLQHGEDGLAWPALEDAVRRGVETRIGLEDVLVLPDGSPAPDNAALVAAARRLGAGAD
ncbi:3-keto-5-aminohexanoate cleavage protein [Amnibacterium kyonggiense]